MNIRTGPRGLCPVPCRDLRRAFHLAIVMAAAIAALYVPRVQAAEPLGCNPIQPVIDVHDARYVAHGAHCFTVMLTVHPTGQLSNDGTLENAQILANEAGGEIVNGIDGSITLLGGFINNGNLANAGLMEDLAAKQAVNNGTFSNFGTFANYSGLANSGSIVTQDGTFANNAQLLNSGTITNNPGGQLGNTSDISNVGTLSNLAGGQLVNSGSIHNSGTLTNLDGKISNLGNLDNLGTFTNQLGTVTNFGQLRNFITLKNGIKGTIKNFGRLSNQGVLTNQFGSTLKNFKDMTNQRILRNEVGATLENQGRLSNATGATLENGGTLDNTPIGRLDNAGTLDNQAGARFTNSGTLRNDGTINNAGTVVSTGVFQGSGSYLQTGGTTTLGFGSGFAQGQIRIDGGALAGSGSIASGNTVQIAASALLTPGDGTGDIGRMVINAPLDLSGSLDIDIDSLAWFDSVTATGSVAFGSSGSTWFNFYLGDYTGQSEGDTFDFFDALAFLDLDAVNYRCVGLLSGLGCELSMIDNGRDRLRLALVDASGGGPRDVPEPGSLGLMSLGLFLLGGGLGWRKRRAASRA